MSPSRSAATGAFLFATLSMLAGPARAQVPPGTAIVGTYVDPSVPGASSGLHLVDLASGSVSHVTGFGGPRVGDGGSGVGTLGLRHSDGGIVVGTVASSTYVWPWTTVPGALYVYVLHLNGSAVDPIRTRVVSLGTTLTEGGVFVAPLPDDRVFVAASDTNGMLNNGPMAGHAYGIVDFAGPVPTVTPLPNPPLLPVAGSYGGGLAADPTGRYVYFAVTANIQSASRVLHLYRIDVATSTSCLLTSWPGQYASGIAVDDDGRIRLSASDLVTTTHVVHTVEVSGCGAVTVTSTASNTAIAANALALDRAAGRFLVDSGWAPGSWAPMGGLFALDQSGVATPLASIPAYPDGYIARQGIAVRNAMDGYGAPTDGVSHYWFDNFPNPGGVPALGNSGFSLTLRAQPVLPSGSLLALSLGRSAFAVAGVTVLVDPLLANTAFLPLWQSSSQAYALPIPSNASLRGQSIFAQSLHLEATASLAASAGLAITIH